MDNRYYRQSIEEKRAKLAELRRLNQERRQRQDDERSSGADTPSSVPSLARTTRVDLETIVSDLLSPGQSGPPSSSGPPGGAGPSSPGRASPLRADADLGKGKAAVGAGSRVVSGEGSAASSGKDGEAAAATGAGSVVQPAFGSQLSSLPPFTDSSQSLFEIRPRSRLTYPKSVQTDTSAFDSSPPSPPTGTDVGSSTFSKGKDEEEVKARMWKEYEAERTRKQKELEDEIKAMEKALEEARLRGPEPAELSSIYSRPDFASFLESSSKIVQRALSDGYDYLRDYTITGGSVDDEEGKMVKLTCSFCDSKWSKHRSVTDVDWSPKFPELSVASFNKNPSGFNEPDGVACVWNLHLLERPEFVFHSQSDVLSVAFSPFHPNLIVGGTYSGQVLLWDTRSRQLPVLKTPLSASGHTHPVYSLSLVGTQNAHNLVSASTDGTVCAWTLDMLARPQETLELVHPGQHKTDEVSVTCMAFPEGEATTFWVGTEEGNVYACNRYDRAGSKAGLVQNEIYRGHSGPVMGIDFHPMAGPVDFSDLFLTCGVDWTVRLWRTRGGSAGSKAASESTAARGPPPSTGPPGSSANVAAATVSPVHSFEEADDYVFDAKWHPHHPALFGSVDGAGKFSLWNLNVDTEVPTVSTAVNSAASRGLNKLAWERRDGKKAAIGGSDGTVYIYDIGELATPKENEWDNLRKAFSGMVGNDTRPF